MEAGTADGHRAADRRSRGLQHLEERIHVATELGDVALQLPAPFTRNVIELGFAVRVRDAPLGFDPALALEAMQGLVQRSVLDRELAVSALSDPLRDGVSVHRRPRERLEDQDVHGALHETKGFTGHYLRLTL